MYRIRSAVFAATTIVVAGSSCSSTADAVYHLRGKGGKRKAANMEEQAQAGSPNNVLVPLDKPNVVTGDFLLHPTKSTSQGSTSTENTEVLDDTSELRSSFLARRDELFDSGVSLTVKQAYEHEKELMNNIEPPLKRQRSDYDKHLHQAEALLQDIKATNNAVEKTRVFGLFVMGMLQQLEQFRTVNMLHMREAFKAEKMLPAPSPLHNDVWIDGELEPLEELEKNGEWLNTKVKSLRERVDDKLEELAVFKDTNPLGEVALQRTAECAGPPNIEALAQLEKLLPIEESKQHSKRDKGEIDEALEALEKKSEAYNQSRLKLLKNFMEQAEKLRPGTLERLRAETVDEE